MAEPISEAKARLLKSTAKKKGKCKACASRETSPIKAMLNKLGAHPGDCTCNKESKVVVTLMKDDPNAKKPLEEKPVEEAKQHKTSPFVQRCVAAITGGKPGGREDESRAFAICNAQKNKSDKNLDKSAKERPGYSSRKAEFVQSLEVAKKKQKKK